MMVIDTVTVLPGLLSGVQLLVTVVPVAGAPHR